MASVRPSIGGKLLTSAKAAAASNPVYSFPALPLDEIVEVLREMGVVVSEDDLMKPSPHSFRQWVELFVLEILSINKEEIYSPSKPFAAALNGNEDLHDDSVPVVHFLRKTNKVLLAARCDEGLSLRDIMRPEKQRVQRVLSALINLYKFRSEKLAWYEDNTQKKEASVARKQELLAQIEHLQLAIQTEMRAREAEQPEIEAVHASTKALEVQRDELTAKAQAIRSTTEGQKEQIRTLKEQAGSVARSAEELRMAIEAKKGQIVTSPAKVKADVAGLGSIVESSQAALDSLEAEKRVLLRQTEVVAKATKDVNKAMTLMAEAEAEAVKLKRVLRDEKAQRAAAEALGSEVEGLRATLGHTEAGKRRAEEKLSTLREEGAAQVAAQARMLGAVRQQASEYLDDAKSASNARRSAENEKMRLESRREALITKHSAEVSDILASVRHLSSSVGQYHTTLFSNLTAVNAISPIGGEREVATGGGRGL